MASRSSNSCPFNRNKRETSGSPDDTNGNLSSKTNGTDTYDYSWDEDNRLVGVELNSTPVVLYEYDSASRLIQRVEGGTTTNYTWDGWDLVREQKSGAVTETTNYLVPMGEVLAFERGGDWYYMHGDALSTTQLVTDENGDQVARFIHGAWGEELYASESVPGVLENRFVGGLGCRKDAATGLIYMRHRWYDCELQRFISRDPIGLEGGSNLFQYSLNNPVNYTDSAGLLVDPATAAQIGRTVLTSPTPPPVKAGLLGTLMAIGGAAYAGSQLGGASTWGAQAAADATSAGLAAGMAARAGKGKGKGKGKGNNKPQTHQPPAEDPEKDCKRDFWTKEQCRASCDDAFKKSQERETCYSVCNNLGGSGCGALSAHLKHQKRHKREKGANYKAIAQRLYDHLCK